ncbi:PHB depolymerase family esterase [Massilia sp. METH4]|uniref:extracellular catalytic domain type 1 short-chain-length polyhydroxyalkanoate depolymerase n=1 Tax=Massilia sp. METH4 TaxID=3123041 RepID=UPI0030D18631
MIQTLCEQWTRLAFPPAFFPSLTTPGISGTPSGVRPGDSPSRLSRFIARAFEAPAGSLGYKLFIPAAHPAPAPFLVVMLHGCGQNADDFASGTRMNEHAERAGCLVMYPEQTRFGMCGGCWNWFDAAHRQRGHGEAALIAAAARQVAAEYGVPADRVYVAGMSAGGAMAVALGCAYPDVFAAVGCHSGLPHGCADDTATALEAMRSGVFAATCAPAPSAVPVIVFHGDEDQTVHVANGHTVVEHALGALCPAAQRPQGARHAAIARETGSSGGRDFTRVVHRGTDGAVLAEEWIIHGAGHAWSGGDRLGSYTDEKGPSASAEMLRFFADVGAVRYPAAA